MKIPTDFAPAITTRPEKLFPNRTTAHIYCAVCTIVTATVYAYALIEWWTA